ncbi:hypothetical protein M1271_07090 [Patescibacteria group bacterium]|nr:hypothetical protein [Patescibacteria group bacterium]
MFKCKEFIFALLILFFLSFSFYPTVFELSKANRLTDSNREFILEHNFYWPDFNLYLSKIRQGTEGHWTAVEKYTSEIHEGSLIQEFYVILGELGRIFGMNPNSTYQLGRMVLSPLLLLMILVLVRYFFPSFIWQVTAFIIILVSGSFPRFYIDGGGVAQVGRYMEWWSNIDALQRITFIPHILFGQVVSFFLLYQLTALRFTLNAKKLIILILLGNAVGLVFPPSLMTLIGVLALLVLVNIWRTYRTDPAVRHFIQNISSGINISALQKFSPSSLRDIRKILVFIFFSAGSFISLLYILIITRQVPWSSLIIFHQTHPMLIPFSDYILGTGPVFFLAIFGCIISVVKRDRKFQPLIFWLIVTFAFALLFTHVKEQSPLRFTQTGLFIPLGILGTYFFYWLYQIISGKMLAKTGEEAAILAKLGVISLIIFYIGENMYMMKVSLEWQTNFITQRAVATIPLVPYPPQTMYPLKAWMDGIRWLRHTTNHNSVVLAEITAGNYIPAYAGNFVYFGQSNTVDYNRKGGEVDRFFKGEMTQDEAKELFRNGRIDYVFFSVQEKEVSGGHPPTDFYPFLQPIYQNSLVTIYRTD